MQAVLNTQELELIGLLRTLDLIGRFFQGYVWTGFFSDVGLGRFKDLDLDVGFFTGWTGNRWTLDGSYGHWTLDSWILKRKEVD